MTLQGEVIVHMLQNTERIDLKYIKEIPHFKIATWLRGFLTAISGGVDAVKYLNFPHMLWFNDMHIPPASKNPSLEFAKWIIKAFLVRCRQKFKAEVAHRCGKFLGTRIQGVIIELNEKDMGGGRLGDQRRGRG
jgi:hypothetical protein